jgi:hypothetical protein
MSARNFQFAIVAMQKVMVGHGQARSGPSSYDVLIIMTKKALFGRSVSFQRAFLGEPIKLFSKSHVRHLGWGEQQVQCLLS